MSKIRTGTELQQWLEEQRLKFQRKKEIEKQRQKKEKAEKKEARKKREARIKKQQQTQVLQTNIYVQAERTLQIYRTNGRRSKFSSDSDLYHTWEEIRYAEDKENGKINWERLPLLIEETRKLINGESKTKRRKPSI